MQKAWKRLITCVFLFFTFIAFCEDIKEEINILKEKVIELEEKIENQKNNTDSLAKIEDILEGINIEGALTFVIQGASYANADNLSSSKESITDASYSFDLVLEKGLSVCSKVYLHFESGSGDGVTDELKVFSNVNADATGNENFNLIEAWYEYCSKRFPLTLTLGKIDATSYIDTNEYANDETTQFLGGIFKNSPVLEFPDSNSAGIRVYFDPIDILDVNFVAIDADSDWEDIFENIFVAIQFNFKPQLLNRASNYRIYVWLNDKNHIRWSNVNNTKKKGYGFGISIDQELVDNLGAFMRYGWQNPKVYVEGGNFSLEHFYSLGFQLKGALWNRSDDTFAFVFGQVFASSDYKDANALKAKSEKHLEIYYSFKVNNHLTLTLDFQAIKDPYGSDAINGSETIFVGGLRTQIDL
ncbi:MAG: hypothetical protein DRO14_03385 [Thermoprotei archaeon]|nr:MAG: hypothetical protein DRO14_03385 [Thermoprotei archaeon]